MSGWVEKVGRHRYRKDKPFYSALNRHSEDEPQQRQRESCKERDRTPAAGAVGIFLEMTESPEGVIPAIIPR